VYTEGEDTFNNNQCNVKEYLIQPFTRRVKSHLPFVNIIRRFNVYGSVHCKYIPIYIQQDATLHSLIIFGNCSYMFRVVLPPIIRSAYNCIYRIWYLMRQIPDAVYTVLCAPDDGWKYHPKHVEQFPNIIKLCNVASCWMYIGILLGAHPILHISRIRVNIYNKCSYVFRFN
jgi:hypothetical protein